MAEATQDSNSARGTRDKPLPIGTTVEVGDWQVTLAAVNTNALDVVMAGNQFNRPPAEGRQFVLFSVDATYVGSESGTAMVDLNWAVVGAGGNTFGNAGAQEDYCGVIPTPLNSTGESFPGATVSGNECVSVPADQIQGATIQLKPTFSIDKAERVYFAVA